MVLVSFFYMYRLLYEYITTRGN